MKLKHQRIIGYIIMAIIVIGSSIIIGNYISNPNSNKAIEAEESTSPLKVINPLSVTDPHCNDDNSWCCNNNYYYCEPEICWNTLDRCNNWLNNREKSCFVEGDSRYCCGVVGYIIDYNSHTCCSPENPYYDGSGYCKKVITHGISVNYFTENSECEMSCIQTGADNKILPQCRENKCENFNFFECSETDEQFIYLWNELGLVQGKCGYECSVDAECTNGRCENNHCIPITPECSINSDCPSEQFIENVCDGANLMKKSKVYECMAGKCIDSLTFNLVETCKNGCSNGSCGKNYLTIIFIGIILVIGGIIYFKR